ncbi:MAG: hypothetical protein CL792_03500 [Chloroflexi bacterium]|nr:hypothetical protein [Chloroflexota bacterium]|tara:strand:+ start:945 stop:1553 length:609 start_codon:yes stop_codon:yes gene_type:complete
MILDTNKEFWVIRALGAPGPKWSGDGSLSGESIPDIHSSSSRNYKPNLEESSGRYPLAPFRRRLLGFLIDELLVMSLLFVIWILLAVVFRYESPIVATQITAASSLLRIGYGCIFNPRGWSPGKRYVGVRIVRKDGLPPGLTHGLIRTAGAFISRNIFLLGYLWAKWDRKSQTLHDKLSGTYVVSISQELEITNIDEHTKGY